MKVLFVCTGNTCRSPMAEALLKHLGNNVEVRSAGIFAGKGSPMSEGTRQVLEEQSIAFDHHSQPVTPELVEWADIILTMSEQHKQTLIMQDENCRDKCFTLKEYVLIDQSSNWEKLKTAYADLEEKKSRILQDHKGEDDMETIQNKLYEACKKDLEKIQELEDQLPDLDIVDPFGGDVAIYRKTREDIEKHIVLLVKKLEDNNS
ncbi:low molecular weight protein arginine phosphatase [Thalassobacillus pellis]|uniref:low molecular weight protein arginine phosphatase n=1 Tax=Thalassobacillus pellis TaxID=748008 RepID=UPI00196209CA|nr:low molecular weight protein arginine phosphatase [Thalassobacillus pellis]MBM7551774.1 protein-tyrosine phosphatase [Thalassobacillus pellis]